VGNEAKIEMEQWSMLVITDGLCRTAKKLRILLSPVHHPALPNNNRCNYRAVYPVQTITPIMLWASANPSIPPTFSGLWA